MTGKNGTVSLVRKRPFIYYIQRDWRLYLLLFVPIACVIIFKFAAYPGLRIAFMDFKPAKGFAGSEWVGFKNFAKIFSDAEFLRALNNSVIFNLLDLVVGFPAPILLALLLNELRSHTFKKVSQTILYLPHFLSWVIVASISYTLLKPETGLVNTLLVNSGIIDKGIPFLTEKWHWAVSYLLIAVWQNMGWGTIIYLAAMTGINSELYEAAYLDGSNRWKNIWYITLPGIKGTAITILIMSLGRIMGSNFERLDAFGNVQVKEFQYQLAIYIYEKGLSSGIFSRATAVGLFQSLVGLLLVVIADRVAKSLGEDGLI